MIKVVEPILQTVVKKFIAMESSDKIKELHSSVEVFIREREMTKEQRIYIKKLLHRPTLDLREGLLIDEEKLWKDINEALL